MKLEVSTPTKVFFGAGSLSKVGGVLKGFSPRKVMVVTGGSAMKKHGYLGKVVEGVEAAGAEAVVFDEVTPDPKVGEVNEGAKLARKEKVDLIVGLGGGSALDAAKAVALCAARGKSIEDFIDGKLIEEEVLPLVAIPSTAGSGSETSRAAIITKEDGTKGGVRGSALFPRAAIVDPELTLTCPRDVTFDAGFDALAHAIESYVTKKATKETDALAVQAMNLIKDNLPEALADGKNLEARSRMSEAATLMGFNIAVAGTCTAHKMQYPLAAHASHGRALAALIPAWMKAVESGAEKKFARVAEIFEGENAGAAVKKFIKDLGFEVKLSDFGVKSKDLPALARKVEVKQGCDPLELDAESVERIYEKAL